MQPLFTYNQEQASTVGASQYISKSGGYDVKAVRAVVTKSQTAGSQAEFLEMDLETREGQKCNYVSICFKKGDGTQLDFGNNLIQAVMGCAGIQHLTVDAQGNCMELIGKPFKAILQRVNFTKSSGEDGYKFDLKLPATLSGQTIQEKLASKAPQAFDSYASSVEDKDERKAVNTNSHNGSAPQMTPAYAPQQQAPSMDYDDDIPF